MAFFCIVIKTLNNMTQKYLKKKTKLVHKLLYKKQLDLHDKDNITRTIMFIISTAIISVIIKCNGCRIYVDIMTGENLSSIHFPISPVIYWPVCLSSRRGVDG